MYHHIGWIGHVYMDMCIIATRMRVVVDLTSSGWNQILRSNLSSLDFTPTRTSRMTNAGSHTPWGVVLYYVKVTKIDVYIRGISESDINKYMWQLGPHPGKVSYMVIILIVMYHQSKGKAWPLAKRHIWKEPEAYLWPQWDHQQKRWRERMPQWPERPAWLLGFQRSSATRPVSWFWTSTPSSCVSFSSSLTGKVYV